tara:strand:- start:2609 stop:3085 length:477 start_codon:yes stop_codon:yes gene_type:complete
MKWSKEEIDYLKKHYPLRTSLDEMSNKLDRSVKSVVNKSTRLSISRPRKEFDFDKLKERQRKADSVYFQKNKNEIYRRRNNRLREIKKELVDVLGGECGLCGYSKCISALEFHHKNNDKKDHIARMIKGFSRQKVLKEAKKCILLCANCHRELHHKGA